jgi:hypothetical protein
MITHMKKTHGLLIPHDGDGDPTSSPRDNDLNKTDGFDGTEFDERLEGSYPWKDGYNSTDLDEQFNGNISWGGAFHDAEAEEQVSSSVPWMDDFATTELDEQFDQAVKRGPGKLSCGDIRGYIQWLKSNTQLAHRKLDGALPKLEEAALVLEQIPYLTKADLLGIGLPLGIVVALQHNYERFHEM